MNLIQEKEVVSAAHNSVGNFLEELSDTELNMLQGAACKWWDISCHGGNDGYFCTFTAECQRSCN
ncbi:plantaricin C family lantibiotic [Ureibacillus aquaedulcis]|uniref:plantaricin C family lantibiotic n=1 Tax=Ureibacillus aquaedulcis TaxID=3058421 RepID=UPI003CE57D29